MKTENLHIRMTLGERNKLDEYSIMHDTNYSDIVRDALDRYYKRKKVKAFSIESLKLNN